MMTISKLLTSRCLISAAAILLPLQAVAQDADWSGAFVGANIGIGMIESEIHDFDEEAAFGYSRNDGPAGVSNLQAGYNWQSGNLVYGAVVSIGTTSFDEEFETDFCEPATHQTAVNALGSVRGRVGLATGNTQFYGTAGVAIIDTDETLACGDVDSDSGVVDDPYEALVMGFGVESMIADNLSVNAEYLSYMADDQTVDEVGEDDEFGTFGIQADTVTIGVNYHFF